MIRWLTAASGIALALLSMGALRARADPAGPTDYRSEITGYEPSVDGVQLNVIGGDSFVQLTVEPGVQVEVVGYGGEPYLRFSADGVVEENQLSPATYLNADRYAVAAIPETTSVSAEPEWQEVASDGSYSWHDHRAHWMNPEPPPGAHPGDQIVEGVIPLVVDGMEVDVTVISIWEETQFHWSAVVGIVVGSILGIYAVRRGELKPTARVTLFFGLLAFWVALVAFLSVPGETAPSWIVWIVPLTSAVLCMPALRSDVGFRRFGALDAAAATLVLLAGVELVIWAVVRRDWLVAAVLPTSLPYWVDRMAVAAVLVGSLLTIYAVVRQRLAGRQGVA